MNDDEIQVTPHISYYIYNALPSGLFLFHISWRSGKRKTIASAAFDPTIFLLDNCLSIDRLEQSRMKRSSIVMVKENNY